ncbi:hypothetical protein DPPLL_19750 [Desulfofustis limnaeus]|uniref:Serine acetyltransferase n=2 Tax=Desulfofustis limnaeus TaxID=2740163 RepID=A0ABM7W9E5_9BACT|nr:hypothetical protein DPPLL_19750 [Desulfofustis limnaeus]
MTIYYLYQKKYGFYIGHSARFTGQSCFPHGFKGIFISGGAKIGSNCVIFQNVTIGSNSLPNSKRVGSPTIGNNVYIGAGAALIGNISIGNDCRIGANCTVYKDVEENSIVTSAELIVRKSDMIMNNKFYKWTIDGPAYFKDGKWIMEKDQEIILKLYNKL